MGMKRDSLLAGGQSVGISLVLRKEMKLPGLAMETFRRALNELIEDNQRTFISTDL